MIRQRGLLLSRAPTSSRTSFRELDLLSCSITWSCLNPLSTRLGMVIKKNPQWAANRVLTFKKINSSTIPISTRGGTYQDIQYQVAIPRFPQIPHTRHRGDLVVAVSNTIRCWVRSLPFSSNVLRSELLPFLTSHLLSQPIPCSASFNSKRMDISIYVGSNAHTAV